MVCNTQLTSTRNGIVDDVDAIDELGPVAGAVDAANNRQAGDGER